MLTLTALLSFSACIPVHGALPLVDPVEFGAASLGVDPTLRRNEETAVQRESAGLTYEIYVRSFADADGDGIGDLEGVRAHLDYLEALGVRTLWLMPVFPAFGPAGYDVTDFESVTSEYGDSAALAALVDDAHALNMRVILDLPLNHTHRDHAWFVAAETGDAAARGHYRFRDETPTDGWHASVTEGSYYAYFGADMPDLDWTDVTTRSAMERTLESWLDAGVDGYRLDAVLMLVEEGETVEGATASHTLLGELIDAARADHEDTFFLAEASEWEVDRAVSWLDAPEAPGADAVLDFPRHDAALEAYATGSAAPLLEVLAEEGADAGSMAAFLGSHDLDRLPNVVEDGRARRALRVAQFLLPGSPVLYYGEELDLANATTGTGQDYAMRAPMPWSSGPGAGFTDATPWFPPDPSHAEGMNVTDETQDPDSMLSLIRVLMGLREAWQLDTYTDTTYRTEDPRVLSFVRETPAGSLHVEVNLSGDTAGGLDPWGYRWAPVALVPAPPSSTLAWPSTLGSVKPIRSAVRARGVPGTSVRVSAER